MRKLANVSVVILETGGYWQMCCSLYMSQEEIPICYKELSLPIQENDRSIQIQWRYTIDA